MEFDQEEEKDDQKIGYPRIMIVDDVFFNIDIIKNILKKLLGVDIKRDVIQAYNGK